MGNVSSSEPVINKFICSIYIPVLKISYMKINVKFKLS